MSIIKIITSPQLWGVLIMAIGLKLIGFGIKLKRGRYVSAQVEGYTEKTGSDGTVTYIPLVSVHTDGEEIVLPISSEQSEKKYDIGQIIDVIYIKGDKTVYMTGFPYIRLGAALAAAGVLLSVGFVFIGRFFDKQIDNVIDRSIWLIIITFLGIAGLAVYIFNPIIKRIKYLKNGVIVEALVGGYIKDMTDFCPVAVFSHNGKKLSMPTNRKQNKREFEIGEKIKIIYDKNKKEVYIYDAHDIKEAVIGMAVGIILIAALILQILLI